MSIDAPGEVAMGSDFAARVNITRVTDFAVYQFDLTYDPTVIAVIGEQGGAKGVTPGLINETAVPVDWAFSPLEAQGRIRVIGDALEAGGVTGSGYLAEIRFRVTGAPSSSSDITLSTSLFTDTRANEIAPLTLVQASVYVTQ